MPQWKMESIENIVNEIFRLYELHGHEDYIGEPVSQLEHMSQSASFAKNEGYDDEVILAAFFHDIGHICVAKDKLNNMDGFGILSHEKVGAEYLRSKGFSERVATLVEYHVQAKRYLTYRNSEYYNSLSEASKKTLEFQGGIMHQYEAEDFEKDPLFELSIVMRKWDEQAKEKNTAIIDLQDLKERANRILAFGTK